MAPVDSSRGAKVEAGFELICCLKSNDTIPVFKYKSRKTGITVFIAEVDGPVVGGNFCFATKAFDDDGLPHTLEHLIFMGSEDYPYKGVLDLLGNRCLASGTNAWTDKDHTNYTMKTVGSEGFLSLMPIYLDHVLFPNLTDAAFLTEVYHISGEGEDRGVVYCEMQSSENSGATLSWTELTRLIYPGKCGYKSVVGGIMKNLRESTTNEKVKAFHQEFYRPENLTIIITGQIDHSAVFKSLERIEAKILSKVNPKQPAFVRPWGSPVPPFTTSVDKKILYPCDEEDNGIVSVGWRGPSAVTDLYDLTGCILLMKYLTDNSVSPIQREFVEVEDPYACDVDFSPVENSESFIYLMFTGVPLPKIGLVKGRLAKVLEDVLTVEGGVDLNRMETVIHRHQLETLTNLENMPHDAVTYMLIGDSLYGRSIRDLEQRLNVIEDLKRLSREPKTYWSNLLEKYFIKAPMAVVNAYPSIEKQKELEEAEKKRISDRVQQLGKEGLKQKEKAYQEAVLHNERVIPEELLTSLPVPGTDSINFHQVQSFQTSGEQHPLVDVNRFPIYTYLNHVNTNFVYLFYIIDSEKMRLEDRPYLPLVLEAIGECPVMREGTVVPYEEVVAQLEADTIGVCSKIGFDGKSRFSCGSYSHSVYLMIQVEMSKYSKGIQWMKELLFDTKFTPDRLKIITAKLINEITLCKKAGNKITQDLIKGIFYKKESNHYNSSFLRQQQFLMKLMEKLNDETTQKEVVEAIERVMSVLTENMVLYMATNVDKLAAQVQDVYSPWSVVDSGKIKKNELNVTPDWSLMNFGDEVQINGCVLGVGSVESSFMFQAGPSTDNFESPDLPAILVCLQYLTQLEGPMWRQVRGAGLAYGCNILAQPSEKLLYLTFYGSTNIVAAYKQTKSIVNMLIEENSWDKILYDSAKSSLIFKIVEKEKSVGSTVLQSLLSYFKKTSQDYNRQMVRKIYTVKLEDLNRVAKKYIAPLFDPKHCKTAIVCHPSKVSEVAEAFKSFNHSLKVFPTLEQSFLNTW